MPICERDPWRLQYFTGVACPDDVRIPTDDIDCWEWFPRQRWIYEKINIAKSQNLPCGTRDTKPDTYPVFTKPNINLKGMGLGSRAIVSSAEFECFVLPSHMWMPLATGDHVSTDCAVSNGKIIWLRHSHGLAWREGTFKHWIIETGQRPELTHILGEWISRNMAGYTGMLNVESIGHTIIEAHLRFADQWCDLYGEGWMDALVGLYADGMWHLTQKPVAEAYSVPLFASHGKVPPHPPESLQRHIRAMPGISSLQITYYEQRADEAHPMPPGGFRLAVINCTELEAGFAARQKLAESFIGCEIILPE